MKLTKKHSIFIAIGIIVFFLTISFLFKSNKKSSYTNARVLQIINHTQKKQRNKKQETELNDFHRIYTKNGITQWEAKGKYATYSQINPTSSSNNKANLDKKLKSSASLNLTKLTFDYFIKGEKTYTLITENAQILLNKSDINSIYCPNFVKIMSDKINIESNSLTADKKNAKLIFQGNVKTLLKGNFSNEN